MHILSLILSVSIAVTSASSQLIVDNSPVNLAIYDALMSSSTEPQLSTQDSKLTISDILGSLRSINIFSGLTRDVGSVHERLQSYTQNSTVLCPSNAAMLDLNHKPWESTAIKLQEASGVDTQVLADLNLRKFVEGHVVLASPWMEGKKTKTLAGNEVWWESHHGQRRIMPADVEVESLQKAVGNGQVWLLRGVLP